MPTDEVFDKQRRSNWPALLAAVGAIACIMLVVCLPVLSIVTGEAIFGSDRLSGRPLGEAWIMSSVFAGMMLIGSALLLTAAAFHAWKDE